MRYLIILLFFITIYTTYSQKVDNYEYHAVYIPNDYLGNISIDGQLNEWDWVPEKYKIKSPYYINSGMVDSSDFWVESFVAWSPVTNKIYIIAKVIDDSINIDRHGDKDELFVIINSNRQSGSIWASHIYLHLLFNFIVFTRDKYVITRYGPRWLQNKDYLNTNILIEKNTLYYELEFNLWEDLSIYSNLLSKPLNLKPGLKTGLTLSFNDADYNEKHEVKIRTLSSENSNTCGEEGSSFTLDPPKIFSHLYDDLLLLNMP